MNYIVFDLEWNQAIDGQYITEPMFLSGEIIEIGAVKLNDAFQAVDELRLYIRPQYYTQMNQQVAALTKINNSCLKRNGIPFPEAMERFWQWCGEDFGFMTWSESDLDMLIENLQLHHMDLSRLPVCYDIQRIFDREIMRENRQCNLDRAIEILGESGDRAHDALHDAKNTVLVCNHLDLEEYIDEYGAKVFAEQPRTQRYDSVAEGLTDPANRVFTCPYCGEPVEIEGWISLKFNRFMAMGVCGEEDEFILYLTLTKTPQGYRPARVLYEMSDDLWDQYQDRLEERGFFNPQPAHT